MDIRVKPGSYFEVDVNFKFLLWKFVKWLKEFFGDPLIDLLKSNQNYSIDLGYLLSLNALFRASHA